ncbi:MAG: hypothetical protein CXR30_16200 [Geobacter sp.]|nr:MAG: hypothetical protein CXR30_16200 [Geobacter sp.]
MKHIQRFVLSLIVFPCFFGCGSNENNTATGIQGVTFVDKGTVAPNPISTNVSIDSTTINYSQSQSGQIIGVWSKQIQFSDYTSVRKVISDNRLYESGNVLPSGQPTCTGAQGMTVNVLKDNSIHSFDIDGGVLCDRTQWPVGVRDLVNLEDALVAKYK